MEHLSPSQKASIIEVLRSAEPGRVRIVCEKESHAFALELCEAIRNGGWEVVGIRVKKLDLPMMTTEVGVHDYAGPGIKAHRLLSALRTVGVTNVEDYVTSEAADSHCVCLIVGRIV